MLFLALYHVFQVYGIFDFWQPWGNWRSHKVIYICKVFCDNTDRESNLRYSTDALCVCVCVDLVLLYGTSILLLDSSPPGSLGYPRRGSTLDTTPLILPLSFFSSSLWSSSCFSSSSFLSVVVVFLLLYVYLHRKISLFLISLGLSSGLSCVPCPPFLWRNLTLEWGFSP